MVPSGLVGLGKGSLYPGSTPTKVSVKTLVDAGIKKEWLTVDFAEQGISMQLSVTGFKIKRGCFSCSK